MSAPDLLDEMKLQEFQKRTARYAYKRIFKDHQTRFLIADEVGLGKTKVAQGVIALATAKGSPRNVLYVASSGNIITQNLDKLKTSRLTPEFFGSLSSLAETIYKNDVQGKLIGLTPIKDLRSDHFGSVRERGLLYKLLKRSHRSLMSQKDVREFFKGNRVSDETFERFVVGNLPRALQEDFAKNLGASLIIDQLQTPELRRKHKRSIIGELRAVLAQCVLQKLNPALVVIDEIQRFSDVLLSRTPTRQVQYLLKKPMLVLSATPYKQGAPGDHSGKDPHKGFIELVRFLNPKQPKRVKEVRNALSAMRESLLETNISKDKLEHAADALGKLLKEFMVRTERPPEAQVDRIPVDAIVDACDLSALRKSMDLLVKATPSAKNKRYRLSELVELWKSTPYVVSALSQQYVTGRDLDKELTRQKRLPPQPAALTWDQLYRIEPLQDPVHPRLRAMIKVMGRDAEVCRLWLPPSCPYVEDPSRILDNPPSKTLVFTSWGAAPPAIATALNLYVEPRPGREMDLEFSKLKEGGTQRAPVKSVCALGAPLWRFAEASDPFEAMRSEGKALPPSSLIDKLRKQLVNAGHLRVSRAAGKKNVVVVSLELNAGHSYPDPSADTASYLKPARDLMNSVRGVNQAAVVIKDANLIAELSAAAPGTCAYRALRRSIPGLDQHKEALFGAAIAIGNSITRLFQRPAAVAIVNGVRGNQKAPYWRKVLRFCLIGDLQSVLDEYVFLLVRDSSERDAKLLAAEVAEAIHVALKTFGGLQVARPRPKAESSYGAAMYARALGEHVSSTDEDWKAPKEVDKAAKKTVHRKGRHANPLLTAFNSPFPPFVLTTTSTGQEGLDMHRYCRRLVHWNLPNSPLALEQREGRIDRYLSLGVRTNIAKLNFLPSMWSAASAPANPWELLVRKADAQIDKHTSILAPLWHFGEDKPIKAIAVNIPFSREETAWKRLLEEASWYRLVLGQSEPHALLDRLSNATEGNRLQINGVRLDLSPPLE